MQLSAVSCRYEPIHVVSFGIASFGTVGTPSTNAAPQLSLFVAPSLSLWGAFLLALALISHLHRHCPHLTPRSSTTFLPLLLPSLALASPSTEPPTRYAREWVDAGTNHTATGPVNLCAHASGPHSLVLEAASADSCGRVSSTLDSPFWLALATRSTTIAFWITSTRQSPLSSQVT